MRFCFGWLLASALLAQATKFDVYERNGPFLRVTLQGSDGVTVWGNGATPTAPPVARVQITQGSDIVGGTISAIKSGTSTGYMDGVKTWFIGTGYTVSGLNNAGSQVWQFDHQAGSGSNAYPRMRMFDQTGSKTLVEIKQVLDADGFAGVYKIVGGGSPTLSSYMQGDTVFTRKVLLGLDPAGFAFRGFEMPTGASGSISWKLPLADAAGCVQSNGSAQLSIGSCGSSGVTSITHVSPIVVTPSGGTGAVTISCPNCAQRQFNETISGTGGVGVANWNFFQMYVKFQGSGTFGFEDSMKIDHSAAGGLVTVYKTPGGGTGSATPGLAIAGDTMTAYEYRFNNNIASGFGYRALQSPTGMINSITWVMPTADAAGPIVSSGAVSGGGSGTSTLSIIGGFTGTCTGTISVNKGVITSC